MDLQAIFTISAIVIAPICAIFIDRYFKDRPKLIAYYSNVATFVVKADENNKLKQDTTIFTHSLVVQNVGQKTANNIRIGHIFFPKNYNIQPAIEHVVKEIPNSGEEIIITTLVPKKQITISYLYFPGITFDKIHSYVESHEGSAKVVNTLTVITPPAWIVKALFAFAILGLIAFIYLDWELFNKFILPLIGSTE